MNPYFGIISQNGLELLVPMNEHLIRFLCQAVYRKSSLRRACAVALLNSDSFHRIDEKLAANQTQAAFQLFKREAEIVSPISRVSWNRVRSFVSDYRD